jgi:hypothetical protein
MKKKRSFILVLSGCIMMVLCGISSCNPKNAVGTEDCQILQRDKVVTAWKDGNYLGKIKYVFIYTSYLGPGSERDIQVKVFGLDSALRIINGTGIPLVKTECVTSFPGDVHYVENCVKLEDLKITSGVKVEDFSYLRFVPITYASAGVKYLAYDIYMVKDGVATRIVRSDPCPPLCPIPPVFDDPIPPPPPVDQ